MPAPRARGDGPCLVPTQSGPAFCSPRPRGWSRTPQRWPDEVALLPAPAGMVPGQGSSWRSASPAPRARGDGPSDGVHSEDTTSCSPRPRVWSRREEGVPLCAPLLPASAGMVRRPRRPSRAGTTARVRGDGPAPKFRARRRGGCSPRPRGWSPALSRSLSVRLLLPAPSCRASSRSGAYCSPRPRGWLRFARREESRHGLLSAPAGMVPCPMSRRCSWTGAPRVRGDGPADWTQKAVEYLLLPAPAGMAPRRPRPQCRTRAAPRAPGGPPRQRRPGRRRPAPRACGDGPAVGARPPVSGCCSPRPRGWSLALDRRRAGWPLTSRARGWFPLGLRRVARCVLLPADVYGASIRAEWPLASFTSSDSVCRSVSAAVGARRRGGCSREMTALRLGVSACRSTCPNDMAERAVCAPRHRRLYGRRLNQQEGSGRACG